MHCPRYGMVLLMLISSITMADGVRFKGVNLSGAEWDSGVFWPEAGEVDYFKSKQMNIFRLAFSWERLQPSLNGTFDSDYLVSMNAFVVNATGKGMNVIVDPHNYARYNDNLIGSDEVPNSAFAQFWGNLAGLYKDNSRVIFSLMNEPHTMPTEQWVTAANAAIAAIRDSGATNLILVPGNGWTGAHSWLGNWYGTSNSVEMLNIVDPGANFAFDLHQYFDSDFSGTSETCMDSSGSAQLLNVTNWLRENGRRGFLGEFAGADNTNCRASIEDALNFLDANSDVWMGWAWWAAGPGWNNYMFSIEPDDNFSTDRPQMLWLAPFLSTTAFQINAGLNGSWYNPETNGQGIFIEVLPDKQLLSIAWFAYDTERPDESTTSNLADAGHRWLTALGPFTENIAQLNIEITSGGVFEEPTPVPTSQIDGTIALEFSDCKTATMSYDIPSIQKQNTIPLVRIAKDNVAMCQGLANLP